MKSYPTLLAVLAMACSGSRPNEVVFVEARADAPATASGPADSSQVYFEFQVEKPVGPLTTERGPTYPPDLRTARVEGDVLVQFVVDREGLPVMSTFKVLRSSHAKFSESIRAFVAQSRYRPAELRGARVQQLVQQPFNFSLPR